MVEKIQINPIIRDKFIKSLSYHQISIPNQSVFKDFFSRQSKKRIDSVLKEALTPLAQMIKDNKNKILNEYTPIFIATAMGLLIGTLGKDLSFFLLSNRESSSILFTLSQLSIEMGLILSTTLIVQKKIIKNIESPELQDKDFVSAQDFVEKELNQAINIAKSLHNKTHALFLEWLLILKDHPEVSPFIRLGSMHHRKNNLRLHVSVLWELLSREQQIDLISLVKFSEKEILGISKRCVDKEDKLLFDLIIKIISPELFEKALQNDEHLMGLFKGKQEEKKILPFNDKSKSIISKKEKMKKK